MRSDEVVGTRWPTVASVIETVSLTVLLVNLAAGKLVLPLA